MTLSSQELNQGGVIHLKIHEKKGERPELRWLEKEVYLLYRPDKKIYEGFIAADLEQKPGTYDLTLLFKPSAIEKHHKIKILHKDYGVRRLTLPPGQVNLSEKDLVRVNSEKEIIDRLWAEPDTPVLFNAPFIMPIESEIIGPFGRRSVINDQPRSPHTGVDLRGKKGTPVKASNEGRVVFTGDHFFTGNTVIIDHGAAIFTMYFHLDKINVNNNELIKQGDILGTVGSTGRSTGPHLHWGVRVNNMRIDPVSLVKVSSHMEE
ncbi:MAG: M23 family metallopeptidase [Desulfatiglans sp.]|nr:M23 family metallopeptidase [Desulfatiglans sp.]